MLGEVRQGFVEESILPQHLDDIPRLGGARGVHDGVESGVRVRGPSLLHPQLHRRRAKLFDSGRADLHISDLLSTGLRDADPSFAKLNDTHLVNAKLNNANLAFTRLDLANPGGPNLPIGAVVLAYAAAKPIHPCGLTQWTAMVPPSTLTTVPVTAPVRPEQR